MITIITGPPQSGKTSRAQYIANAYKEPFQVTNEKQEVPKTADLIIYEEMDLTGYGFLLFLTLRFIHKTSGLDAVFITQDHLNDKTKSTLRKKGVTIIDLFKEQ
nr:hypothetical protein [uncultured Fluviicola sp.]